MESNPSSSSKEYNSKAGFLNKTAILKVYFDRYPPYHILHFKKKKPFKILNIF